MALPFTDPDTVVAAAQRVSDRADQVRTLAARATGAAGGVCWHSPAARAFADDLQTTTTRLRRCADDLDHAAQLMRAHARTARHRLAQLQAAEHATERLATGLLHLAGL